MSGLLIIIIIIQSSYCALFSRNGKGNDVLYYNPDLVPIINMWVQQSDFDRDEETRLIEEKKVQRLTDIILRSDINIQQQKYQKVLQDQNVDITNLKYLNKLIDNFKGQLQTGKFLKQMRFKDTTNDGQQDDQTTGEMIDRFNQQ